MTAPNRILVIGATGTTGSGIVRAASRAGITTRGLARDLSKVNSSLVEHADYVAGDLSDKAGLVAAMSGVDAVYLNIVPTPDALNQLDNAVAAAREANVGHVVKLSGLHASADSPSTIIRMHSEGDDRVRASGIDFTILRANSFYQNILSQLEVIKATGMFYLPLGAAHQSMIDVEDIAEAALAVMTDARHRNKAYDLTGPASITQLDIAQSLARASGHPVVYVPIPGSQFAETLRGYGMPEAAVTNLAELFAVFASGVYAKVEPDLEAILGRPGHSYDSFADRIFNPGAPQ
jgi:uncharacterized protein YbjT (DUF2867 family)